MRPGTLRALGPDMDPEVAAAIDARLAAVAVEHGVRIPWAIESGSRAWGFPSPDSDYDCRFFFLRAAREYSLPWRPRDVIETPLDAVLDVNGWDVIKAVRLAVAGNATVSEWLRSPLVYAGEPEFRADLRALVEAVGDRRGTMRHYLHVGRAQWTRSGAADDAAGAVALKRVFYGVRPALVLHWMDGHAAGTPPMNVGELMAEAPPPPDVADEVTALTALKARTRELGRAPVPAAIAAFVRATFAATEERLDGMPRRDPVAARADAGAYFLDLLRRWA